MKQSKRQPRTYKVTDSVYKLAMKRAKKEKIHLSNKIENWVSLYAEGNNITALPKFKFE